MSRTVKVLIWILIGIPLFLIVSLFIAFQVFVNMASPDHAFGEKPLPLAPDYSVRSNWAGWPDKDNPVERLRASLLCHLRSVLRSILLASNDLRIQ